MKVGVRAERGPKGGVETPVPRGPAPPPEWAGGVPRGHHDGTPAGNSPRAHHHWEKGDKHFPCCPRAGPPEQKGPQGTPPKTPRAPKQPAPPGGDIVCFFPEKWGPPAKTNPGGGGGTLGKQTPKR